MYMYDLLWNLNNLKIIFIITTSISIVLITLCR